MCQVLYVGINPGGNCNFLVVLTTFFPSVCCAFHNSFPMFLGFGYLRKLVRTKNQQGTEKSSEHNGRAVFLHAFVFCMYE